MEVLRDDDDFKDAMNSAREKMHRVKLDRNSFSKLYEKLLVFIRMMSAYLRGDYTQISRKTLLIIGAALLYFINPLDLIPDIIPVTGYVDDLMVVVWVFNRIQDEVNRFSAWEENS